MSRRLMVFFAAIVFGGTSYLRAAELSSVGADWDQDGSIELVSAKKFTVEVLDQIRPVGWMESTDAAANGVVETTMVGHQSGCCPGAPCDWLNPCGGWLFEAQTLWLRAHQSEGDYNAGGYDNGSRFIMGHMDSCGRIWRARYFNHTTQGEDTYRFEYLDFEHARRFALPGTLYGELSAGLRWSKYNQDDDEEVVFTDTIGPVIGAELRGLSIMRWDAYASARHSIQFGKQLTNNDYQQFTITEMQLGLIRNVDVFGHRSFFKGFFEAQNWASASEDDSEDIGLVGLGIGLGTTF